MRRVFFIAAVPLLLLSGCEVSKMSSLPELSKPYVGVYECETITLGGEDYAEKFDDLRLELGYDGAFTIVYSADGNKGELGGNYTVDPEAGEITLSSRYGLRSVSYTFPMEKGKILIDYNFSGKLLHAEFSAP